MTRNRYRRERFAAPRFTPLERAVMDALAHDLRREVPDLAGQFGEALPGLRRNTAFGAYVEMIVDRNRPAPAQGPTGLFGSVHAMVADLPDPVAFQVQLRHGRLLGLQADSYGHDTRHIDFQTAPFEEVFYLDDAGDSILFEPFAGRSVSPRRQPPIHALAQAGASPPIAINLEDASPPPARLGVLQRMQEPSDAALNRREPAPEPPELTEAQLKAQRTAWLILIFTGVVLAYFLRGALVFVVFVGFVLRGALNHPDVLSPLARLFRFER